MIGRGLNFLAKLDPWRGVRARERRRCLEVLAGVFRDAAAAASLAYEPGKLVSTNFYHAGRRDAAREAWGAIVRLPEDPPLAAGPQNEGGA